MQAAEAIIKESVEPLLEDYRPPGITSLKFSKLSLGTVSPKIEGSNIIVIITDHPKNELFHYSDFCFIIILCTGLPISTFLVLFLKKKKLCYHC